MIGPALASEAALSVLGLTAVALLLFLATAWSGRWRLWLLGLLTCATAVLAAFLYRDPPRSTPMGPDLVVAPADGWVLSIDAVEEPYLGGEARRIRIRAGLFELRTLRSPVDGVVDYTEPARHRVGLSTGLTRVLMDFGERRPVIRITEGELLDRGQRVGVVRAGGELVVLVPYGVELAVGPAHRVRSGESILARAHGGSP